MKKPALLIAALLVLGMTAIGFAQTAPQIQMGPGDQCGPLASVACTGNTAGFTANVLDNTAEGELLGIVDQAVGADVVGTVGAADQSVGPTAYCAESQTLRTTCLLAGLCLANRNPFGLFSCASAILGCYTRSISSLPDAPAAFLDCPEPTVPAVRPEPSVPAVPSTASTCVVSGGCPHEPVPDGNGAAGCIGAPSGAAGCVCVDGICVWDGAYESCDAAAAAACTSCRTNGVCQ